MITLYIGIWLQPRKQPTFSVCQLPASSLASTFYSLKLCLPSLPLVPLPACPSFLIIFPTPLPFSANLFSCAPLPTAFSFCAVCIRSDFRGNSAAAADVCLVFSKPKKNRHSLQHAGAHDCASTHTCLFHVDYLETPASGCNNSNICLLSAALTPCMWQHTCAKPN